MVSIFSFDFTVPARSITLHAVWLCTHISTAEELIDFSSKVNPGTNYRGTTVFLDDDIDFSGGRSEQFEPIGKSSKHFQGTFDGQGHTINNLAVNSSSEYIGLFGYSKDGATIRNVVLDSSCSVVSSYSSTAYVGGIIGYCYAYYGPCVIENTVNMASVSFTGSSKGTYNGLYIGGIAGYLSASSKEAIMKNCANYGSITHSGTVSGYVRIGGIVGCSYGYSSNMAYIKNCLNYGTITHSGKTSSNLYIGGILGCAYSGTNNLENCVSGGKITSNKQDNCYIGGVVGYVDSRAETTTIKHCCWTSDVGCDKACGSGNSTIDSETSLVSLNTTTMDNLNSYNSSWSKWVLNTDNKSITFKVNDGKGFNLSSQLILLPSLAESENHTFSGWFEDEECTKEFTDTSVAAETTLYGGWSYVLTFDPAGGVAATSSKSVVYGQKYGKLSNANRTGYTFTGWFTKKEEGKGEKITEDDIVTKGFDHTLYAQWTANDHTVTLNVNGGDVLPVNEFTVTYGQPYNCLPNVSRTGHTFNGWFTEATGGTEITNETIVKTSDNHTLYAQWTANNYTLTFDFGNGTTTNRTLTFNETIFCPVNLTREGYTLSGWKPKPERMPAEDTTVVAQWIEVDTEIESEYVEIVFGKKDMTEEEVKEIIKSITQNENFYIERIETDKGTGETIAIIRFTDAEKAKDFVWRVSEGRAPSIIKRVRTVPAQHNSFALKITAMPITTLLILYFMCAVPA